MKNYTSFPLSKLSFVGILFCVFVLASMPIALSAKHWKLIPAEESTMVQEVLTLINQHRKKLGLNELRMNDAISKEAYTHSKKMAKGETAFGHDGFDDRINRLTTVIPHSHAQAENVAYGATTAKEVVDMWLHSAGHKKNIEGHYNLTGIGIAADKDGTLYFTQIFFYQEK